MTSRHDECGVERFENYDFLHAPLDTQRQVIYLSLSFCCTALGVATLYIATSMVSKACISILARSKADPQPHRGSHTIIVDLAPLSRLTGKLIIIYDHRAGGKKSVMGSKSSF